MTKIFNEETLRQEIYDTWGEHGSHAEVINKLLTHKELPSDEEVNMWFEQNIDAECSASSAIYKFRLWIKGLYLLPNSKETKTVIIDKTYEEREQITKKHLKIVREIKGILYNGGVIWEGATDEIIAFMIEDYLSVPNRKIETPKNIKGDVLMCHNCGENQEICTLPDNKEFTYECQECNHKFNIYYHPIDKVLSDETDTQKRLNE